MSRYCVGQTFHGIMHIMLLLNSSITNRARELFKLPRGHTHKKSLLGLTTEGITMRQEILRLFLCYVPQLQNYSFLPASRVGRLYKLPQMPLRVILPWQQHATIGRGMYPLLTSCKLLVSPFWTTTWKHFCWYYLHRLSTKTRYHLRSLCCHHDRWNRRVIWVCSSCLWRVLYCAKQIRFYEMKSGG